MTYVPRLVELDGKHPLEVVDYPLEFDDQLVGAETISAITSVTVTTGLTLTPSGKPSPAISGDAVVFWVGGGTHGETYTVQVVITTSGGRTLVADASITVTDPTP
jgi:hypothetical protein